MIKRFSQDRDIRILTGLFTLSRVIFYTAGIRMNLDLFVGNGTAQLPDLLFLKEKLAETLYYMHGQPPLYNLYCGLLLKFFSNHLTLVVHSHFLFLGWLQALVLFKILQKLSIQRRIIWAILVLHILLPSNILYENWLFYTYPVVTFLLFSLYLLLRFAENGNLLRGLLFFSCLATVAMTRSMFHLVWLVAALILLIFLKNKIKDFKVPTRKLVLSFVLPFSLVFAWYLKNYLLFGCFTASSWMGMNMSRMLRLDSTTEKTYPLLACYSFQSLDVYRGVMTWDSTVYPDVAVLHQPIKKSNSASNFFNVGYISVSKKMQAEALDFIKKHPFTYLREVFEASTIVYLQPASLYAGIFTPDNYNTIKNYVTFFDLGTTYFIPTYNKSVGGDLREYKKFQILRIVPVSLVYLFVFVLMVKNWRNYRNLSANAQLAIAFILFNFLYVFVVGNLLEYGENMRFRYQTTPLGFILIGILLNSVSLKKRETQK